MPLHTLVIDFLRKKIRKSNIFFLISVFYTWRYLLLSPMYNSAKKQQMTEIFWDLNQGTRYYRFMKKKTRGWKSHATVPLIRVEVFLVSILVDLSLLCRIAIGRQKVRGQLLLIREKLKVFCMQRYFFRKTSHRMLLLRASLFPSAVQFLEVSERYLYLYNVFVLIQDRSL